MELDNLIGNSGEWLKASGPQAHIVISSRVRLARNLTVAPFPNRASDEQLELVLNRVEAAIKEIPYCKDSKFIRLTALDAVDRQFLVERHLMSLHLAANPKGRAVIVSSEEILSIMVNEEDHLRLQVMQSGFNLSGAWQIIDKIDDALAMRLPYAFHAKMGFLTACPTNMGTALRGSVMVHLPALVMTNQINQIQQGITKLRFTVRGFYGEGSGSVGHCYQISNQISLGQSEENIIFSTNGLIQQVIQQEERARDLLLNGSRTMLEDRIHRAWGILNSARIMTSQEAIELVSMVRLGVDVGILKDLNLKVLNEVFLMIQPAHLQKREGRSLVAEERDILRAKWIREKFK